MPNPFSSGPASTDPRRLSQRRILLFWLPLAASWIFMATEMPFINAVLARLTDVERMIAAFGIVASLSITIESPVIMLLATSTALARSRQSYLMLRRFTLHLMIATTAIHVLLGWTPLFDLVVGQGMKVPATLLEPVRLGMRLVIFWSAAIAWRRFKQGVMIRYGQTRYVGQGTLVRLASSAGTALVLGVWSRLPGVAVGACALSVGVLVEAAYAHSVARATVAEKFGPQAPLTPHLSYLELVKFHAPLGASTLLFLLTQPLISAVLSRLPQPELVLAAWPVASGLLFLTRSPAVSLPEAIITLVDEPGSFRPLRTFSLRVGLVCTALLALLGFTPLGHVYFRSIIGVSETLADLAQAGARMGVALPLIMAVQNWLRGLLTARRATAPITLAMAVNLASLALGLLIGLALRWPGVPLAALAMSLSTSMEAGVLWAAAQRLGVPVASLSAA